jgi:endonuclease-3
MVRIAPHNLPAEKKAGPVLRALEKRHGRPRRRLYNPLEVLVSGILSQNTTDVNSDRAFDSLLRTFGSWEGVAGASQAAIARAIRESGLAAQKAATIKRVMRWLGREGAYSLDFLHGLPAAEVERRLTAIKGIGIKTARLTALFGFGLPTFVVDTHVHRVAGRLGLVPPGCTRERAHLLLDALIPDKDKYSGHLAMIYHGRRICRARNPLCGECAVRKWCVWVNAQRTNSRFLREGTEK